MIKVGRLAAQKLQKSENRPSSPTHSTRSSQRGSENCSDQLQRFRRCQADVSNGVCPFYSKSVIEFEAQYWLNYGVDEFQLLVECWKESARTWPGSILDYLMERVQRA